MRAGGDASLGPSRALEAPRSSAAQRRLARGQAAHPLVERAQRAQELLVDQPLVDGLRAAERAAARGAAARRGRSGASGPGSGGSPRTRAQRRARSSARRSRRRAPAAGRATRARRAAIAAPAAAGACARATSSRAARRPPARLLGLGSSTRAQQRGGVVEVRLRPLAVGGIGLVARADRHAPVDQPSGCGVRKSRGPAVAGGHDRLAEQHRLGEREAEALGAVQRQLGSRSAR